MQANAFVEYLTVKELQVDEVKQQCIHIYSYGLHPPRWAFETAGERDRRLLYKGSGSQLADWLSLWLTPACVGCAAGGPWLLTKWL
tara:strand:- start:1 stop:258 length:258 start_codon:yes stop_codon:yes gene_type:complete